MREQTDALARLLFNKPSVPDCSLEQVEYLAQQYPYFSVAQLLLLQKTETGAADYLKNSQRAALHFSNPLLLEPWLHEDSFETKLFQNPISDKTSSQPAFEQPDNAEAPDEVSHTEIEIEAPELVESSVPDTKPTEELIPEKIIEPEAAAFTFEPYHTVDYFASQGIKLSQQEAGSDTLGKQMKSFTEWLKTMKRLPETVKAERRDAAGEQKVENLAAHSLYTPDVVTEAMAEVWLKQGNAAKAADVYDKLRLRIPAKSAYFAAKIQSLKTE